MVDFWCRLYKYLCKQMEVIPMPLDKVNTRLVRDHAGCLNILFCIFLSLLPERSLNKKTKCSVDIHISLRTKQIETYFIYKSS
jgi:hypothetical protein